MTTLYLRKRKVKLEDGQQVIQYDFSKKPEDITAHRPYMAVAGVSGAVKLSGIRRSVRVPADREEEAEYAMEQALGMRPATERSPIQSSDKPKRRKTVYVNYKFVEARPLKRFD